MTDDGLGTLLTLAAAAARLGVSRRTLAAWARTGVLPSVVLHPGRQRAHRRIPERELERVLQERLNGAASRDQPVRKLAKAVANPGASVEPTGDMARSSDGT